MLGVLTNLSSPATAEVGGKLRASYEHVKPDRASSVAAPRSSGMYQEINTGVDTGVGSTEQTLPSTMSRQRGAGSRSSNISYRSQLSKVDGSWCYEDRRLRQTPGARSGHHTLFYVKNPRKLSMTLRLLTQSAVGV